MTKPIKNIEVGIDVETSSLDEAVDKIGELSELTADMAPQVSIRNCCNCTFNIYPSRTVVNENGPIWKNER